MLLTFLGVRGSTPAPGADFVAFGGHTSCIAVSSDNGDLPRLVLDAGTGLRSLSPLLTGNPYRGSVLLSHLHWDHMQGIPFFTAGDRDDSRVDVYLPAHDQRSGRDLVAQAMQPPTFPITPEGLRGDWSFTALEPGAKSIEGFTVTFDEIRHKGGRTFGYRISDGSVDVAYLPDHLYQGPENPALETLIRDVDVLIHDAQFLQHERALADAYGHSTVGDCLTAAEKYQARSLVLFHHSPARTDEQMNAIGHEARGAIPVLIARQGAVVDVAELSGSAPAVAADQDKSPF